MVSSPGQFSRSYRGVPVGKPTLDPGWLRIGIAVLALAGFAAAVGLLYWPGLAAAVDSWSRDEYSYGYVVPFIAAYLLLRELPEAVRSAPDYRWIGPVAALFAVALGILGGLSRIADISGYGFILALAAASVSYFGLSATRRLWVPLTYLLFMLPLPQVIYLKLSSSMQLVSSELGAGLVRLLGIPVLLEGNVIDLGNYQLQVAEACSGLRYMFPLMSFGFLFAVLYRGPSWQKWTLFLSVVPITIVMNSVRIAVIGVLVTYYGIELAEGFLHFFQGWVIFLGCLFLLFAEACVLLRFSGHPLPLREALDVGPLPSPRLWMGEVRRRWSPAFAITGGLVGLGILTSAATEMGGANAVPPRQPLVSFASELDGWHSSRTALPPDVLRVLAADDYLYADYTRQDGGGAPVNLFIAYYSDQRDGRAVHSPQVCLIGGGWEIRSFRAAAPAIPGRPDGFRVNRAIIQKGLSRALVYYWFEERGRTVTSEYMAKWHILWDGITRHRTDGALVRLVTPLKGEGDEGTADARLTRFLATMSPHLPAFLPR